MGSFQIFEGGSEVFTVICTSTGGRPLTMSVTGPSGVVEDMMNIVVEGNVEGMGNDTFSAKVIRQNGNMGISTFASHQMEYLTLHQIVQFCKV